ncbi:hypothetical protein ABMA28_002289 [Loxostege sticticalis]|uniref:CCHC-type domain-containing protein n=1 Tax=Loxostege sticticalis TaxID=481309 RepID=A0ABD0T0E6_LOXSC
MSEEKELIKRRGSFKGRLTVFTKYLEALEVPLSDSDARELQVRMGKIESLYDQYDQVQLQLECLVEEMDTQLTERARFESLYYKALSNAQGLLDEHTVKVRNLQKNDRSFHTTSPNAHNNRLVKLPTIQLPKFSGSYDNWLEFHDTFTSLIHSNDEIDDINKFHYLRASLEGSAAVVIHSIAFSASNFAVAWKLLCERYDNKRLLIQNHVSALFHLDAITKESSAVLKRFIDQINKNLRALESLGEPVKQWDTLLIHIVTQKLDHKTYREWEEFKCNLDLDSSITFEKCIQFLRNRADLVETLELSRSGSSNQSSLHNKSNPKLKSMVIQNSNNSSSNYASKLCRKCQGDHTLDNCPQFRALSPEARFKELPAFKVCFNCFRTGHFANTCKRPGCKVCKRRHNTLVHVAEFKPTTSKHDESPSKSVNATSSSNTLHLPVSTADNSVTLSANIASSHGDVPSCEVLLSTTLVKLCDSNNREHIVRAVLDCGSTSCLMTESICRKLNLPTDRIDKSILGINNVTSHVGKTCRVNLKSLDDSFNTVVNCCVLPSITSNVPSRQINISDLQIPSNICLADPMFYKPSEVDLLIGADLFWDLLGSQQIRLGNKKPVLHETKLGWIISGSLPINHVSQLTSDVRSNFSKLVSSTKTKHLNRFNAFLAV